MQVTRIGGCCAVLVDPRVLPSRNNAVALQTALMAFDVTASSCVSSNHQPAYPIRRPPIKERAEARWEARNRHSVCRRAVPERGNVISGYRQCDRLGGGARSRLRHRASSSVRYEHLH